VVQFTFHADDLVVVDVHGGKPFEVDLGLAIEIDVEGFSANHGFSVSGECIQRCEVELLVDRDGGFGFRLGLGNFDVQERSLALEGQTSAETVDKRVIAAVASDHAVQLKMHAIARWIGHFLGCDFESGRINLVLCFLGNGDKYDWKYDDQDNYSKDKAVFDRSAWMSIKFNVVETYHTTRTSCNGSSPVPSHLAAVQVDITCSSYHPAFLEHCGCARRAMDVPPWDPWCGRSLLIRYGGIYR
jgi:hypothetical protein